MKRALILTFILATAFFSSCKEDIVDNQAISTEILNNYLYVNYPDLKANEDGLYIIEESEGTGTELKQENYILVNYLQSYIANSTTRKVVAANQESVAADYYIHNEKTHYTPDVWKVDELLTGVKLALKGMKVGGKIKVIIPSNIAYGANAHGTIPAYSSLIVEFELVKVISNIEDYEAELIKEYTDNSTLEFKYQESKIYLAITEEGEGDLYTGETLVTLAKYTGKYLDGKVFDSGINLKVFDGNSMVEGFEAAVKLMKPGCKATVIIPYSLGYKEAGNSGVKGYETLVFELEAQPKPKTDPTTK